METTLKFAVMTFRMKIGCTPHLGTGQHGGITVINRLFIKAIRYPAKKKRSCSMQDARMMWQTESKIVSRQVHRQAPSTKVD